MNIFNLKNRRGVRFARENINVRDEDRISKIDNSIDVIISGIRDCYKSILSLKKSKLTEKEKKVFEKVTNLLDTAISPYMVDIVKELDKLEEK